MSPLSVIEGLTDCPFYSLVGVTDPAFRQCVTYSLSIVPHYGLGHPPRYRELRALGGRRRPVGEEEEEVERMGRKWKEEMDGKRKCRHYVCQEEEVERTA